MNSSSFLAITLLSQIVKGKLKKQDLVLLNLKLYQNCKATPLMVSLKYNYQVVNLVQAVYFID